jgi:hypothetical protein
MRSFLNKLRPGALITVHGTVRSSFATWCSKQLEKPSSSRREIVGAR